MSETPMPQTSEGDPNPPPRCFFCHDEERELEYVTVRGILRQACPGCAAELEED